MRALVLAVLLVTCAAPPTPQLASAPPTPTQIAEKDTARVRTDCARRVLSAFLDAFNAANTSALASFFSATRGAQPFQWFVTSETPPHGPDITRLPETFAMWHATGQRWRLVSVESGDGPSWHGGVDFAMKVERSWPDRSVTNIGKGALDCSAGTIFVFGLGD